MIIQHVLSDSGSKWEFNSEEIPCSGLYSPRHYKNTLSIKMKDFVGTIILEGTLGVSTKEWVPIKTFILPQDDYQLKQSTGFLYPYGVKSSGTLNYDFLGRYSYIRIKVQREYLLKGLSTAPIYGAVGKIQNILLGF